MCVYIFIYVCVCVCMYATPTWYIFPAPRLSPSGGVDSSLFEYAPMQAKDEHTRFKKFMSKILEQRAGYGREEGSKPPALSAKWEQMALHGARVEYTTWLCVCALSLISVWLRP